MAIILSLRMLKLLTLFLVVGCVEIFGATLKECTIGLKKFRQNAPIYVQSGRLLVPETDTLHIGHNQVVTIACPGTGNKFKKQKKLTSIELTCNNGDFQNSGKTYDIHDDLKCHLKYPEVDVVDASGSCGNREGSNKNAAFKFGSTTIPLYDICYKTSRLEAIYSKHTLEGGWWQGGRPDCRFAEHGSSAAAKVIDKLYKGQETPLAQLLKGNLDTYYKNNKKYLSRGHFAPCGDFHLDSTMSATFLYVNAAPQWQDFNGGSWSTLEELIHKMVKNKKRTRLTIYTGASTEILKLPDDSNALHDVYLNTAESKQPVPKYFWKVVIDADTNEGTAFVGLNDVEGSDATLLNSVCHNICKATKFNKSDFNKNRKGLLTCCSVKEAKSVIPRMSEVPTITKNLVYNG